MCNFLRPMIQSRINSTIYQIPEEGIAYKIIERTAYSLVTPYLSSDVDFGKTYSWDTPTLGDGFTCFLRLSDAKKQLNKMSLDYASKHHLLVFILYKGGLGERYEGDLAIVKDAKVAIVKEYILMGVVDEALAKINFPKFPIDDHQ